MDESQLCTLLEGAPGLLAQVVLAFIAFSALIVKRSVMQLRNAAYLSSCLALSEKTLRKRQVFFFSVNYLNPGSAKDPSDRSLFGASM